MKTYQGSCHCGAVQFEADIDLARGTVKCNCSICVKMRWWAALINPAAFRLKAAAGLAEYRFGRRADGHLFCRNCGVHTHGTGHSPRIGDFVAVSVSCLDGVGDAELAGLPVTCMDGRNDDWSVAPGVTGHL